MTEISLLFNQLHFSILFWATLIGLLLSACEPTITSHDDRVKVAIHDIQYEDGLSKQEAKTIADAYLILYGKYKGRAMFARMSDADTVWVGKVYVAKSLASPVDAGLPPVIVDKTTGRIRWKFGPDVEKIDLEALQNAEPSVAVY